MFAAVEVAEGDAERAKLTSKLASISGRPGDADTCELD